MYKPVVISESPDKSNLIYRVQERNTIDQIFTPLVTFENPEREQGCCESLFVKNDVKNVRKSMDFFHSALKEEFTDPVGAPNLARYRLVDMYVHERN